MNETKIQVDKIFSRVKKNPVISTLIIFGTIVVALSTFTDAARNILDLVVYDTRSDINGEWVAEITYDWDNANYTETFTFGGDGAEVHGTASYLGKNRAILEGKVKKDKLQFITTTRVTLDLSPTVNAIHEYRGRILGDTIKFTMQTKGGYSEYLPIKFIAKKVSDRGD